MATKILAIDDSKTMRLAIKITFAAEDAEVTSVSKGSDAVARIKAKQGGYDVVLVDASLAAGEPSGYEVCRAIKQDPATAKIPVVLLVSNQSGVDEAQLASADLTTVAAGSELETFAKNAGAAVFRANCVQCHGAGASGAVGYPNLLDDEWMWGGTMDDIIQTVTYGIRNEEFPDARYSEMPSFGRDELLTADQINEVVQHVLALSGQPHDAALASAGEQVFLDNCA